MKLNGLPAVNCARPGKWGNPFKIGAVIGGIKIKDAPMAVASYRVNLLRMALPYTVEDVVRELRGKNLACWCAIDGGPCHCDTLLEIANSQAFL